MRPLDNGAGRPGWAPPAREFGGLALSAETLDLLHSEGTNCQRSSMYLEWTIPLAITATSSPPSPSRSP